MDLREYVFGTAVYTLTGADPEGCLNRLNLQGLQLWDVVRKSPLSLAFTSLGKEEERIRRISEKACCRVESRPNRSLKGDLLRCIRRPCLILSILGAMILSFLMEGLIWKIQIESEDPAIAHKISHVLRDNGVDIWTKSGNVDPQQLRYRLLMEIPELSWVAVNPKGGKVTVLALIKETREEGADTTPGNLIACREGIITESIVLEGMSLMKPGQSVRAGQILVSGVEDYGLYLKAVRAQGEIYGQTWHCGTMVTPSYGSIKQYTGRTYRAVNLIIGRKFINLSGSSSILGGTCDKMIDTEQLRLPGCPFPLYIQRVTYREYTLRREPVPQAQARELLQDTWERSILSSMIAGRVEKTDATCFEEGGLYIFCGESICHELLSRFMELEPLMKGEDPHGTDH